jgi:hypothetical protein
MAISLALLAYGPQQSDYTHDLLLPMALLGLGAGLAFPSLTILAMSGATAEDAGLASGLINTSAQVGGALGLAVLATLSTQRTGQLLAQGQRPIAALSGGYHLAWAVGAGLIVATIFLAATLLRSARPDAANGSEEADEETAEDKERTYELDETCA